MHEFLHKAGSGQSTTIIGKTVDMFDENICQIMAHENV